MSTSDQGWFHDFYQELKRRRVIRVATLYVILCWPIIQIVDILSPAIELPPATMRYLLIVFVVGLPVALILSWLFDLNKSGIVRVTEDDEKAESEQALIGHTVERSIIGALVIVIAVLFYMQFNSQNSFDTGPQERANAPLGVRAIAVLPFVTFSSNRDDQFFSDGLTEELLNVLSKLQNLRVTARTSSFAYKGVNKNVQEIGLELNVDTILEGSVRRNDVDDTIRVTAQLIEVQTGTHVWSETFDHEYRDVFKIQDAIAAAVVEQLKVTLDADEQGKIKSRDAANPEAMVALSMGRSALATRTQQSLTDALRYFNNAVKADPTSAEAFAGLAKAHALLFNYAQDSTAALDLAQRAVSSALENNKASAEAWAAQGLILMQRHENNAAMEAMQKAMTLNPSHAMAHMWYGNLQEDEAQRREFHARAFELDPYSPVAGYNYASDLIVAGREAEAMDVFSKIVDADPYFPLAYDLVGQINEFRGRLDVAIRHYKRVYQLEQRGSIAAKLATLYIDIGDFTSADQWIAAAVAHSPGQYQADLEWMKISASAARGDDLKARAAMRPMLDVVTPSVTAYMNAASAGYFLSEPNAVISAWDHAQNLPEEMLSKNKIGMSDQNLQPTIAAAYAFAQTGRSAESNELLQRLESLLDEQTTNHLRVNPDLWYVKAQVMAIKGETNLALIHLQRAVDEGWRQHWRPAFEPCFSQMLELPTLQSMMAGLAARMDLMREQLEFDSAPI